MKVQFQETDIARKISHISFSMLNAEDMQRQSHLQVVAQKLYTTDGNRKCVPYGVLDHRMGTSEKDAKCETCGEGLPSCVGHYGYIDLALPVFHVGYFKAILNVLQIICKKCSRHLLQGTNKMAFLEQSVRTK